MDYAYSLSSGAPVFQKYQIGADSFGTAGVVATESLAGDSGVQISTTTTMTNAVGVTMDTATYVTAQQTDGTSAERQVSIIISPDAVFRALMSGGATSGTALTLYPVTTASSDGLVVTTASIADWESPDFVGGAVWGYDGANAGQSRRVATASTTAATVLNAFDQDTVVGDNFLRAPWWGLDGEAIGLQTTTNLTQADATIAVATGGAVRVINMELNDLGSEGRTTSKVLFILDDHALGQTRS